MAVDQTLLTTLEWRCIGPYRGGRVVAVAGDPLDDPVFYFGACAGGVWKTNDGGTYWENISDGFFNTASVGAIAVSESDPNVIYVGTGDPCIQTDLSHGDGVYKSTDRGESWVNMGLADTRHIARIRVHPRDPNLVYVAAVGHIFGPNGDRGVYRSKDGGANWEKVLFKSEKAGAVDLSMDPNNPRILYATIWETLRTPWSVVSGGPDSGIWKTMDGGDTWAEITNNPGLPEGLKGRIGVAVSPANPDRVWATIEAKDSGLFRSDDGGDTWDLVSDNQILHGTAWYYEHVFAHPQDPDTVWVLNNKCWKSVDGGKSFTEMTTSHGDQHDLWIDPRNPQRMIEGNDGGACISFNNGASWSTILNQPTAQFYHVTTDTQFPYRVYGTQQDNSAISVPSRSRKGAILWDDCYITAVSESGHIAIHPEDSNLVFSGSIGSSPGGGGNLLRYDHKTGQVRLITVWPELYRGWGAKDMKYRFAFTFPILFSPHDPNVLYTAGNMVFRSTDQGASWEAISPDLTRQDVSKLEPSEGPVSINSTSAEVYCTIFSLAESPHEKGVFWAGTDDGLVHISRDGGKSWNDVTPPDLPEWALINMIELSPHDRATAYIAATRYKLDDTRPMLYKTNDYGQTWVKITDGIPEDDFTRVIREDKTHRGLLYAGTETAVYVSFDDGASWQSMQANLPRVPIHDLVIKDDDLVAATHGRSFWVLDDLPLLHQLTDQTTQSPAQLFKPRTTLRVPLPMGSGRQPGPGKNYRLSSDTRVTAFYNIQKASGESDRVFLDAGKNPPDGVVVSYYLKERPQSEVTLDFMDAGGQVIQRFSTQGEEETQRTPITAGMNRFVWNIRYPSAHKIPGDKATEERSALGPLAPPGTYQVTLKVDGHPQTESFLIVKDPRVDATEDDFKAQFDLLIKIRDKLSETHDAIGELHNIRSQVEEWVNRAKGHHQADAVSGAADTLKEKLSAVESELAQVQGDGVRERVNPQVKLNRKLAELSKVVDIDDFGPTKQAYDVFDDLSARIDQQLESLKGIVGSDVPAFNELVSGLGLPAIVAAS